MARAFLVPLTTGRPVGRLSSLHVTIDKTDRLVQGKSCQGRLAGIYDFYGCHRHIHDCGVWRRDVL